MTILPSWLGPVEYTNEHLYRGVRPRLTIPSDSEVPLMLELRGMQSTPSLPSLLGQLWLGVVAADRDLSMGQIELNYVLIIIIM